MILEKDKVGGTSLVKKVLTYVKCTLASTYLHFQLSTQYVKSGEVKIKEIRFFVVLAKGNFFVGISSDFFSVGSKMNICSLLNLSWFRL